MNIWPAIKISLITVTALGAVFNTSHSDVGVAIGWAPAITGLLFFPVIVLVGLFVLKVIFRRKLSFEVPTWGSNPLDFSHPEHFFHLGGLLMLTSGVGGLVGAYFGTREFSPFLVASITFGLGILVGIWVLKVVHDKQS